MNLTSVTSNLVSAWNSGDVQRIAGLYARDAVMVHALFPETLRGREAILAAESPMFGAFSDIDWKLVDSIASDDRVAVEWQVEATHSGEMPTPAGPLAPTGRRIVVKGSSHFRFDEKGSILSEHRYLDGAAMFAQLTG